MACCRCGTEPRSSQLASFFCDGCRSDGIREARIAEDFTDDFGERRAFLMDRFGWAGWAVRLSTRAETSASAHAGGRPIPGGASART